MIEITLKTKATAVYPLPFPGKCFWIITWLAFVAAFDDFWNICTRALINSLIKYNVSKYYKYWSFYSSSWSIKMNGFMTPNKFVCGKSY